MNCHGNNDNNGKGLNGHKGPMSHMLMMFLCCAAPILLLLLLPLLRKIGIGSGANSILSNLAVLICPIMMIGMMIMMMMKGQKGGEDSHNHCTQNSSQEQVKKLDEKN